MRILHLNDRLSRRGGADIHMLSIIKRQHAEHAVYLAVGRQDGTAEAGCPLYCLQELAGGCTGTDGLECLIGRLQPDHIHVHNVLDPMLLECAAAHDAVTTVQDHRSFCPGMGKWKLDGAVCSTPMCRGVCDGCFTDPQYFERIFDTTRRRLDAIQKMRVIVLSTYMRRELIAAGVPAGRITVVPPFVDDLNVGPSPVPRPSCVLFVGRLVRSKGVYDAIDIWQRAEVSLPLVFAGTGVERTRIEDLGFHVSGWLDRAALASWYRRAAAVIMTPRWQEPFGIVGLEALSLGIPVIAWASGGIEDWHPGPLFDCGDVVAAAAGLRSLASQSVAPAAVFDPDRLMAELYAVYQTASEER